MFFAYYYRDNGKQQVLQLGRNCARDSRIPEKMGSESLNKCEKSGKKAKYAVFFGSDKAAGKCFERGRYMTVNSRSGNLSATILIHVCCHESN